MTSRRMALAVLLGLAACAQASTLDGRALPPEAWRAGAVFFVEHQPRDGRNLHETIALVLRSRGLRAVTDPAVRADYVVEYTDRWDWDARMYLIDLRIDVRDASNGVLVATARSYQSSLAAMGETHRSVIERTVGVLVAGPRARAGVDPLASGSRPAPASAGPREAPCVASSSSSSSSSSCWSRPPSSPPGISTRT